MRRELNSTDINVACTVFNLACMLMVLFFVAKVNRDRPVVEEKPRTVATGCVIMRDDVTFTNMCGVRVYGGDKGGTVEFFGRGIPNGRWWWIMNRDEMVKARTIILGAWPEGKMENLAGVGNADLWTYVTRQGGTEILTVAGMCGAEKISIALGKTEAVAIAMEIKAMIGVL